MYIFRSVLLQPMDRLRTISQQLDNKNKSLFTILKLTTFSNYGGSVLELWRGLSPVFIKNSYKLKKKFCLVIGESCSWCSSLFWICTN